METCNRHDYPLGSAAARGQRISLRGVLVLELSDGLVGRSNWDGVMFQRQLNNSSMEDTK
jgi:hypothetical protein